jgi:hypothetical protein
MMPMLPEIHLRRSPISPSDYEVSEYKVKSELPANDLSIQQDSGDNGIVVITNPDRSRMYNDDEENNEFPVSQMDQQRIFDRLPLSDSNRHEIYQFIVQEHNERKRKRK